MCSEAVPHANARSESKHEVIAFFSSLSACLLYAQGIRLISLRFTFASTLEKPESYCGPEVLRFLQQVLKRVWGLYAGNVLLDNPKKAICMWDQKSLSLSLSLSLSFKLHDNIVDYWCNSLYFSKTHYCKHTDIIHVNLTKTLGEHVHSKLKEGK